MNRSIYNLFNSYSSVHESTPERGTYYIAPIIHKLSGIARMIQKPLLNFTKKRKILYIKDWTSIKQANQRSDTMVANSINPLKGYYYHLNQKYYNESDNLFPKEINREVLCIRTIKILLDSYNIKWEDAIIQLFINNLSYEYIKYRHYFVRCHAIYSELFEYYKPEYVVIPGENEYHNVIVTQLTKMLSIKSVLLIDGYSSYLNKSNFFKNENNSDYIFDIYLAQGKANYDLITSSGVNDNKCIIVSPPIIDFQKKYRKVSYESKYYEAVIMAYIPFLTNISALYDHRIKIETQLIHFLHRN